MRFCEGSIATRVPTFDGVPIDANVTLPATRSKNLPLVIQLHGWAGSKSGLGSSKEWAEDGYAVLNYSARGFGDSCGSIASRTADPNGCARGWVHLSDSRYEARDSQYLAGLLADQGIVAPRKIGVTGGSYGGGQSLILATLRDRVRLKNGKYVPWRSPKGKRMEIAAAAPTIPWSDLVHSLTPNGGTLDTEVTSPTDDLAPLGIMKLSYQNILYGSGMATGFYSPKGVDPSADLTGWFELESAGEPYAGNPAIRALSREIAHNHSAYYLKMSVPPAPILISNGFTDDLFPADEAVRYANRVFSKYPRAAISQLHFDYGHPRGQAKEADTALLSRRIHQWFDHYVKGKRGTGAAGRRGPDPDLPAHRSVGRALPGPDLGRRSAAARCASAPPGPTRSCRARATRLCHARSTRSPARAPARPRPPRTSRARPPTACPPPPARATRCSAHRCSAPASRSPAASRRWPRGSGTWPPAAPPRRWWPARSTARVPASTRSSSFTPTAGASPPATCRSSSWWARDSPYGRPSNFDWSIAVSGLKLRLPVLREAERRRREVTEAPVQALAGVTFGWSPLRRAGAQDGAVSPRCPHRASS